MDPIEKLLAIEEIKTLKARYFRFVDTQNWNALRTVFTADAVIEVPEALPKSLDLDDAMGFFKAALQGAVSVHFGHMPEIDVLGAATAKAIWPMDDRIYWPPDKATELGYSQLRGFGHYHETYGRADGDWRIEHMRLTRLRLVTQRPIVSVA
jgi:hypothetical protein